MGDRKEKLLPSDEKLPGNLFRNLNSLERILCLYLQHTTLEGASCTLSIKTDALRHLNGVYFFVSWQWTLARLAQRAVCQNMLYLIWTILQENFAGIDGVMGLFVQPTDVERDDNLYSLFFSLLLNDLPFRLRTVLVIRRWGKTASQHRQDAGHEILREKNILVEAE